jgi:hypothetical protein
VALEQNRAEARSLASADFDEDGVPDLVSGYAGPDGGIVTIHRGNVDSIYPNAPEAKQRKAEGTFTDAPFLSPALVFSVPEAVDFVGAGDFDGDSHWDVVAARKGGDKLHLLSGDGKGGLGPAKQIEVAGGVTAMAVGEINRRDGLDDVVVGVTTGDGTKVLVFEGPEGALRATPEVFSAPDVVKSLALSQLDSEYTYDLAVASGKNLLLVQGRDRKLSLDARRQAEVAAAKVERREFGFEIRSLAVGDFSGSGADIALLAEDGQIHLVENLREEGIQSGGLRLWGGELMAQAGGSGPSHLIRVRSSSLPVDNLLVLDRQAEQLQIISSLDTERQSARSTVSGAGKPRSLSASIQVEGSPMAVLPMRLNSDALSDLVVLRSGVNSSAFVMTTAAQTFVVVHANNSGSGSLRDAVERANAM